MTRAPADPSNFTALAFEVRRMFHALRVAAEELHEDEVVTPAHRSVLESLARRGPQTVPSLASERPVSRQHIQVVVDRLAALGLVVARPNPAHRRSSLIALTARGRRRFAAMRARETRAIDRARFPATSSEMAAAAATLRALRTYLAGAEWKAVMSAAKG